MLVATPMGSYAISFHAAPGLEMIRFAPAIFKDGRTDQQVRRATPLLFTQHFPTAQSISFDRRRHLTDNSLSCVEDFDLPSFLSKAAQVS
jgi:hypothetical protein